MSSESDVPLFDTEFSPRRTEAAYKVDWQAFETWAKANGHVSLPATPATVATYGRHLLGECKPNTVLRALSSIAAAHRDQDCPLSMDKANAIGRLRKHLREMRDAQPPTLAVIAAGMREIGTYLDALEQCLFERGSLLSVLERAKLRAITRDRALITVAYAGALKATELASMEIDQIVSVEVGMQIRVGGYLDPQRTRDIIIPAGFRGASAVEALAAWIQIVGERGGPVWRPIMRDGTVESTPMSTWGVRDTIGRRFAAAGLKPTGLTTHSLRAGSIAQQIIRGDSLEAAASAAGFHPESVRGLRGLEERALHAKPSAKTQRFV